MLIEPTSFRFNVALYLQLFLLFVHDSFGGLEGGQYKTQDEKEGQVHL